MSKLHCCCPDINGETTYFAAHLTLFCFVTLIRGPHRREIVDVISIV